MLALEADGLSLKPSVMARVIFIGEIFPRSVDLAHYEQSFRIDPGFDDLAVTFDVKIEHSFLKIVATADTDDEGFAMGCYWRAIELAIAVCDLACLRTGVAHFPVLERTIDTDGSLRHAVLADRSLAARMSVFENYPADEITELIVGDVHLAAAVNDLAMMLKFPNYAPIAAGRVLDAVVHMISGGHDGAAWERMRTVLHLDRSYIQPISDTATPQRHGNRLYVPAETNRSNADRVWNVMNRYLIMRMEGAEFLDPNRFELLR